MAVAIAVLAVPFVGFVGYSFFTGCSASFADTIGEIPIPALGKPAETPLSLNGGTSLLFAVSTQYSYSGNPTVMLDISLQKDGAEVAKTKCNMKSFSGFGASGSGATVWTGDAGWNCGLDVPEGGATSVRATVRRAGSGALTLQDTSVVVKRL